MRILGKDSYWWKKEEKEWVMQDQNGDWYVYKRDEKTPPMKIKIKRTNQHSLGFSTKEYMIIALGAALGVSFALNIVALIL